MKDNLVDAGITVGKIIEMSMGSKYTSVHIREEMNCESVNHIILVKNEVAFTLKMGQSVCVKLEVFV